MSSFKNTGDYEALKATLRQLCTNLELVTGKPVFCAPFAAETQNFDAPAAAYSIDIQALRASEKFIMVYPPNIINSGISYEAGYAGGLGLPQTYFVQNATDLPFMLREADKQIDDPITIVTYRHLNDIVSYFQKQSAPHN